ncbi:hypothetical protein [Sedimenticola sp.]|uniref:hypothetical protein n=1 Tax=Sedimenticola sp. TaxID=1940285 RepID=UPI003D0E1565
MRYRWRRDCLKARVRAAIVGGLITLFCNLAAPATAVAGVFRCPDGAGGVLFQQVPCAQGEEIKLDVHTTKWAKSPLPRSRRQRSASSKTASRQHDALARAAQDARKQKLACWKAQQRVERIEAELRHGYKPARGERLHRQLREQSDYLREFCR